MDLRQKVPFFMNYANGYVDTVSGTSPLSLPKAKANSLQYVKVFGGTEQNGTPTPTVPVDIVSNNGVVKALINHWDMTKISGSAPGFNWGARSVAPDGTLSLNISNAIPQARIQISLTAEQLGLQAGKTYTVKAWILDGNAFGNSSQQTQTIVVNGSAVNFTTAGTQTELTHTWTQAGANGVTLGSFYVKNYGSGTTVRVRVMVTEGETIGDYIPHTQPVIYTDGTVETIEIHGKNLFDVDWEQGAINGVPGQTYEQNKANNLTRIRIANEFYVDPTKTYTISINDNNLEYVFQVYDSNHLQTTITGSDTWGDTAKTFTGVYGISVAVRYKNQANIDPSVGATAKIQLELGSTATTYEPYFNGGTATAEMMLKVGDYQDVQSIIDGVVTRKLGVKVLDGTETCVRESVGGNIFYRITTDINHVQNVSEVMTIGYCTHCKAVRNSAAALVDGTFVLGGITNQILIGKTGFSTVEQFQQWLADQYANGTPVTIVYPLATPTTESVTGQTLQVQAGNNTLEITQASLNNLTLEAKYKRSK